MKMEERRSAVRLAGGGPIDAAMIDRYQQPISVLQATSVINISAGGMAFATSTQVEPESRIRVSASDNGRRGMRGNSFSDFDLQVLACTRAPNGQHLARCKLKQGLMPTALIYRF